MVQVLGDHSASLEALARRRARFRARGLAQGTDRVQQPLARTTDLGRGFRTVSIDGAVLAALTDEAIENENTRGSRRNGGCVLVRSG
jgi:hypothetical protein